MQKTKFNKRVSKQTPVVRIVQSKLGLHYFLAYNSRPGYEHELLVKFPPVLWQDTTFRLLDDVNYGAMRDWLRSKAF